MPDSRLMTTTEHSIWGIEGSDDKGWYLEGSSTKVSLPDYPDGYGWFCIEVDTWADVINQATELGFTASEVTAALA